MADFKDHGANALQTVGANEYAIDNAMIEQAIKAHDDLVEQLGKIAAKAVN